VHGLDARARRLALAPERDNSRATDKNAFNAREILAGAFLAGLAWNAAGWSGCVATIAIMRVIVAMIVAFAWERSPG
jgi:hypothetical protein